VRVPRVREDELDFVAFYEASRDSCLRAVVATVGDRRLAEELVSEAFARAWTSWRMVRHHPAPKAWVLRTAMNLRVSLWRRRRREVPLFGQDPPMKGEADNSIDATLIAALRRLPTRQREVITLRVLLDLDTETTAKVLGIAAGTVMSHLSRAASALRHDLTDFHNDTTMEKIR
jgi:RNA polymerase sigma-70 factor (sigma-E family)